MMSNRIRINPHLHTYLLELYHDSIGTPYCWIVRTVDQFNWFALRSTSCYDSFDGSSVVGLIEIADMLLPASVIEEE